MSSVPSGSVLVTSYPPPTCRYIGYNEVTTEVPAEPDPDADPDAPPPPPILETGWDYDNPDVRDGGSYVYREVAVERDDPRPDLLDSVNDISNDLDAWNRGITGAIRQLYTPIDELSRRFTTACAPPDSDLSTIADTDSSQYPGFIDVGPFDPLFDLNGQITDAYERLPPTSADFVEPPTIDRWGGLVVRNPSWLSVTADSWGPRSTAPIDHFGYPLTLLTVPQQLDFVVAFDARDAEDSALSFVATIPCIGSANNTTSPLTVGGQQVPARPGNLVEFDEPSFEESCTWTPPARGDATITPVITYGVTLLWGGYGLPQPDLELVGNATTTYVGELRAVNVNDAGA